jgi:hypothetical protein
MCLCEKYNCFMQCDGIHDDIGSIFIDVTSSIGVHILVVAPP